MSSIASPFATSPGGDDHAEGTAVDELDGETFVPPFLMPPSVVGDVSAYLAEIWKLKPKPCDDTDDEEEESLPFVNVGVNFPIPTIPIILIIGV